MVNATQHTYDDYQPANSSYLIHRQLLFGASVLPRDLRQTIRRASYTPISSLARVSACEPQPEKPPMRDVSLKILNELLFRSSKF